MKVIKRDGRAVEYDRAKIEMQITKYMATKKQPKKK